MTLKVYTDRMSKNKTATRTTETGSFSVQNIYRQNVGLCGDYFINNNLKGIDYMAY